MKAMPDPAQVAKSLKPDRLGTYDKTKYYFSANLTLKWFLLQIVCYTLRSLLRHQQRIFLQQYIEIDTMFKEWEILKHSALKLMSP